MEPCREIGYRERYVDVHLNMATVLFARGLPAEGRPFLEKAEALYRMYEPALHPYAMDMGLPSEEARSKNAISAIIAGGNLVKVGLCWLALGEGERARRLPRLVNPRTASPLDPLQEVDAHDSSGSLSITCRPSTGRFWY